MGFIFDNKLRTQNNVQKKGFFKLQTASQFRQTKFIVQSNVAIRANPALIIHLKHSAQSINCITVGTSQTGSDLESKMVPCLSLANSDIFNVI